jgi:hypothetical protein
MGAFLFFIIVLGAIGWGVGKVAGNSDNVAREWRCPHGYDEYACNKGCPLYHHCAGCGEEAFIPRIEPGNDKYDYDTLPAGGNEDGDWRTVYMDDERYDDREEDELYDDDKEENGW